MAWNGGLLSLAIFLTCLFATRDGLLLPDAEAGTGPDIAGGPGRWRRQADNASRPDGRTPEMLLQQIVDTFGTNGRLTEEELQEVLEQVNAGCYSAEQLLSVYSVSEHKLETNTTGVLQEICPTLLYQAAVNDCMGVENTECPPTDEPAGPTAAQVWGYGLLCVTIISLGSLMGAVVVPCMDKNIYKLILTYLVGLAVGTLTGSALLHLIPKTHGLKVKLVGNELVWKNTCILAGIYVFFFAERILKILATRKDSKREDTKRHESFQYTNAMHDTRPREEGFKITSAEDAYSLGDSMATIQNDVKYEVIQNGQGHSHGELNVKADGRVRIASVAYMIVLGDGLHNFMDGLAIGASFSSTLLSGFSTSIAIACEEFPHELGDFAVLLKSGLSVKQAMGFNFLSSLACYVGLIIGILVGRLTSAEPYIFALAAGMFLYIALVDMLPEITNVTSKTKFRAGQELKIFLLQNAGMLSGFGIMILLSVMHPYIKIKG